jgi:DHA2 family multidrug resistance protein
MNVVKREHIGQVSTVLSVIMQVGGAFGVAMLGTIMSDRTAVHYEIFKENITSYSVLTQSGLKGMAALGQRIGELPYWIELQKLPIVDWATKYEASICGFQDAFIVTAFICFLAMIPALGLFNLKLEHVKKGKGGGAIIGE